MIEWVEELRAGFTEEFGTGPKIVTLATVEVNGPTPLPRARTVVCRALDDDGQVLVTTDMRSPKCAQVGSRHAAELSVWFASCRRQFRIYCETELLHGRGANDPGGLRERLWSELTESARALFFWPAPGAPRDPREAAFPAAVRTGLPPDNFALIALRPIEVDLLELAEHPHRRRRWRSTDEGWRVQEINP